MTLKNDAEKIIAEFSKMPEGDFTPIVQHWVYEMAIEIHRLRQKMAEVIMRDCL
jgi:hypothetical protein